MIFQNEITLLAQRLYPEIYKDTSNLQLVDKEKILIGDKCAEDLCKLWQKEASLLNSNVVPEATVAGSSPIDLLDAENGIAYELKYSHKNVKHEFYKDLFKILIYNDDPANNLKINRFVFLCHHKGISSLMRSSLSQATVLYMKNRGIDVSFIELYPSEEKYSQTA
jgi:hypothetical protein